MASKKTILSIAIDKELLSKIKKLSEEKSSSVSKLISNLIEEALYLEENVFKDDIYQNIDWLSEEWRDKLQVLFTKVLDTTPDPIWIKDLNLKFIYVNQAFEKTFGVKRENIIGKGDVEVLPPEVAKECIYSDMKALEKKESSHSIEKVPTDDGKEIVFDVIKTPIFDRTGKLIAILGISRDITEIINIQKELERKNKELEEAYQQLRNIYEYDVVTGLLNKEKFIEEVYKTLDKASNRDKFEFILMEISNLIYANEVYGYDFGNKVLKEFAEALKKALKENNFEFVLGRISGYKFGLLVKSDVSDRRLLRKFLNFLKNIRILAPDDNYFVPKVSFVVKDITKKDKTDFGKLIVYMEDILIKVRENRRKNYLILRNNMSVYEKAIEAQKKLKEEIETGKLSPSLRPIIELSTGKKVSYEVSCGLSSIRDEELCYFVDNIYIEAPLGQLDEKIIQLIKRKVYPKLKEGEKIFVKLRQQSIEVMLNMPDTNLSKDVLFIKDKAVFEITEDTFVKNIGTLHELKNSYNLQFCLDSFGTGNASIKNLIRMFEHDMFQYIKMSENFIKNSIVSAKRKRILKGVIAVTSEFGIKTIASGISSEKLLDFAKEMGFDYATGKLFNEEKKIF
ncbi:EAL domain-containing protein [Persephonella sp. IF05-L8]|uniref:EAL domain-containing protein n=1 Tax=Persephonella sp. IF05-L8 TaxID=1158338 RepID=UPI000496611A